MLYIDVDVTGSVNEVLGLWVMWDQIKRNTTDLQRWPVALAMLRLKHMLWRPSKHVAHAARCIGMIAVSNSFAQLNILINQARS